MENMTIHCIRENGLTDQDILGTLRKSVQERLPSLRKVLLLPPDYTRARSGCGGLANRYYHLLKGTCEVHVMPAHGSHQAMSPREIREMYGDIPQRCFRFHNWHTEVVRLGEIPEEIVDEITGGILRTAIPVDVNRRLLDPSYDLIISIGQVIPHEVVGMANYTKNILVGCGGSGFIHASHITGALYGLERLMARDFSPVRRLMDYAQEHFLINLKILYLLSVSRFTAGQNTFCGLFAGSTRDVFERAVTLSQRVNVNLVEQPLSKVVVYLNPEQFKSTWIGNKAIYRTRMAIANGGELLIIAPGIERFGEDGTVDALIRRYGYTGRKNILKQYRISTELRENQSVAAHLIHGSSDGRFGITYCTGHLPQAAITAAGYRYMPCEDALRRYPVESLREGFNMLPDGETVYFIPNPAVGLWAAKGMFQDQSGRIAPCE